MANRVTLIVIVLAIFLLVAAGLAVGLYFAFRTKAPLGGTGGNTSNVNLDPAVRLYTIPAGQILSAQTNSASYQFPQLYYFTVTLPGSISMPARVMQVYTNATANGLGRIPAASEIDGSGGISLFFYSVSGNVLTVYYPVTMDWNSQPINNLLVSNSNTIYPVEVLYV